MLSRQHRHWHPDQPLLGTTAHHVDSLGCRLLPDLRCSSTMAASVAAAPLTKCSRLRHRVRAAATPFQLAPGHRCRRSRLAGIPPAPPSARKRRPLQLCSRLCHSNGSCAVLGRGTVHSIAEGCRDARGAWRGLRSWEACRAAGSACRLARWLGCGRGHLRSFPKLCVCCALLPITVICTQWGTSSK